MERIVWRVLAVLAACGWLLTRILLPTPAPVWLSESINGILCCLILAQSWRSWPRTP
ncbi:MAG: hypothetical protein KC488_09770 [Candidatus Cloacimonetes bacterium]|nr:hypothetical protein [Candidatus Cloacimonadota bacterium]